jgi:hypothetical protein
VRKGGAPPGLVVMRLGYSLAWLLPCRKNYMPSEIVIVPSPVVTSAATPNDGLAR